MKQEQIDQLQALLDAWYSPIRRDGIKFYDTDGDVLATFDFEPEAKMFMDLYDAAPALLEAARENLRLREALREANILLNDSPNYHAQGMGCGLEDRSITDRYEAAEYGWNECLERYFMEIVKPSLEIIQDALGKESE